MQLENKKALVTGAAGGIGQAIVARLQAEGAMVAASDLDLAASAANMLIPGDLRDTGYADELAKEAHDALGGLDIVVNNAGIITRGAITETTDDDLARTMAINFDAPFRICRAAIPLLEASGGGAIVNTSSCWGVHPGPAHTWVHATGRRHILAGAHHHRDFQLTHGSVFLDSFGPLRPACPPADQ